ncbi:hypothetical protein EBX31_10615 [bacterium]|nr:hypothetical protein [bacterium]
MKDPREVLKASVLDKEKHQMVVSWGYVGPQPKVEARHATYHFPPGLSGVKQMTSGDIGHLFVKDDGTLVCWDISLGLGGRTLWHKHLEETKSIEKAVASRISPETLTQRRVNMGGVFLWEKDGACTFHYKHYDSYSDYLSWSEDKTPFKNRFKKKPLGTDIYSVILANSNTLFDIAIRKDGTLIPVNNSIGRCNNTDALTALVEEINNSGETRLVNIVKAFSRTSLTIKDGGTEHKAHLVWLTRDGEIWSIHSGQKAPVNVSHHIKLPRIDDIEASMFRQDDPMLFLVLVGGTLKRLNLSENTLTDAPKQASYDSLKEKVQSLSFCFNSFSLALTESGRCLFVTAQDLARFKPNYRRLFSKKWLSPENMRFSRITATVNLGAITDEVTFLGLTNRLPNSPAQKEPSLEELPMNTEGRLLVWGKDSHKDTPIAVQRFDSNIGPVLDATLFKLFYIGLAAVLLDGSLVVMNPVHVDRGDVLDSIPPWFLADFCRLMAKEGSGLMAQRKNGETLKWGPSEIREGILLSLEKVSPKILAKLPSDFKKAQKLVGAGGSSCFSPPYHYLAPDVVAAVL